MILHFKKSGLHTSIQDRGRNGYQAFGVPTGGALDKSSAKIANWLLDNPIDTPVLEITLMGPTILIEGDCQIALAGADLSPAINKEAAPMYETINVKSGAILSFGKAKQGCRAYLAVRGFWKASKWLGSCSLSTYAGSELTPDNIIRKDSSIEIESLQPIAKKVYPRKLRPDYSTSLRVRVLPGPEFEAFSPYAIGYFFSRAYSLTPNSNRMGYRLNADMIDFKPRREVISSGVVPGTIQVTNSGQPIVLMADAQTSGGYFRLANIISADMDAVAQLKPGDEIWFSLVKLEEAYKALAAKF